MALSTNDLGMLREAAIQGIGVARVLRYVVAEDLRASRLVEAPALDVRRHSRSR